MNTKRKVKSAKATTVNNPSKSKARNTANKEILVPDLESMDLNIQILNERVCTLEHALFSLSEHEQEDCGCGKDEIKKKLVPVDILLPVAAIGFLAGVLFTLNFTGSRYY